MGGTYSQLDPDLHASSLVQGLPEKDLLLARHLAKAAWAECLQATSERLSRLSERGLLDVEQTLTPGVVRARASARLMRVARALSWVS